jgi:hypothetical protein
MKYFGTVKSFDTTKGLGEIKQEAGGNDLGFEKSYDVGTNNERQPCALNLQTV